MTPDDVPLPAPRQRIAPHDFDWPCENCPVCGGCTCGDYEELYGFGVHAWCAMGGEDCTKFILDRQATGCAVPGPWLGMKTKLYERLDRFWDPEGGQRLAGFCGWRDPVELDITPEQLDAMLDATFCYTRHVPGMTEVAPGLWVEHESTSIFLRK